MTLTGDEGSWYSRSVSPRDSTGPILTFEGSRKVPTGDIRDFRLRRRNYFNRTADRRTLSGTWVGPPRQGS